MTIPSSSQLSPSDVAAWWGAIVASIVLVWDIIKWRMSQTVLRIQASPNMRIFDTAIPPKPTYITLRVCNRGGQPTTIELVVVFHHANLFHRLLRKADTAGVVLSSTAGRVPHLLGPGEVWTGLIDQDDVLAKCNSGGYLYCGVNHSRGEKPVLSRVKFKPGGEEGKKGGLE